MYRRNFLKTTGLVSLTPLVPGFVNTLATNTRPENDQRILVVIELSGGNDGINTLVPHKDDEYKKLRPKLALPSNSLHRISDSLGLHSSMRACKAMFDDGQLAIINGVGYPNPNRSHFESMGIWHSGLRDSKRESGAGWLGHAMDLSRKQDQTDMDGYFIGRDAVSAAMIGRRAQVAALNRFRDLQLDGAIQSVGPTSHDKDIAAFVQRQVADSYEAARKMEAATKPSATGDGYRDNRIGRQMKLVSRLIQTGSAARVYYTTQSGYDTHSAQPNTHANLLFDLSNAMKAFTDDMNKHGLGDRVVVLAFSEFGRRVHENGSLGTDHGTAGPVFLSGSSVKAGLFGQTTSLTDLEDGDIKKQFDFRQVYATVLDQWLNVDSKLVLGSSFQHLDLLGT